MQFLDQIYQEGIVMKCLIIAAGQGTRLKTKGEVKPLVPLLGVPLIERVIRTAMQSGVHEFYVVTGYQGEKVGNFLKQLAKRLNIAVTIIHNEDWEKENGVSVLKAKNAMTEPFLLLMADHLFDTAIIRSLQEQTLNEGEVLLAVDTDKNNPLIDMEDVSKTVTFSISVKPLTISTVLIPVFFFVRRQYLKRWNVPVKFTTIRLCLLQYGF